MSLKMPDHSEYVVFAELLANYSRSMLIAESKKLPKITIKSDSSYVTETDKAVEQKLREEIQNKFPDHGIIGEEFEDVNRNSDFVWILDPIDGTAAFVAGIPVYGTLIALAWKGKPFIGIIDHPLTDDRWVGVSNRSSFKNGIPITTRSCNDLTRAYVTCSNPDFMSENQLRQFKKLRDKVAYVQYGASCFAYGTLASGRSDFAVDAGLEAFDVFACAAVIQGAGGIVTSWTGDNLTFDMDGTVIAAGDKNQIKRVLELLNTS
jgi:inositol-phosphate phosphatase/L-galactose 1-phosphate phosphatase/histidinol-phosphatase